jgi:hypothetical protein
MKVNKSIIFKAVQNMKTLKFLLQLDPLGEKYRKKEKNYLFKERQK